MELKPCGGKMRPGWGPLNFFIALSSAYLLIICKLGGTVV